MANPIFEAGLFFVLLGFAFFFTFITFKGTEEFTKRTGLRLLAMALFMILAIVVGSGDEIAYTTTQTITNPATGDTWNETNENLILPGGTASYWLAYLFYGFAILNLIVIAKEYAIKREKDIGN